MSDFADLIGSLVSLISGINDGSMTPVEAKIWYEHSTIAGEYSSITVLGRKHIEIVLEPLHE